MQSKQESPHPGELVRELRRKNDWTVRVLGLRAGVSTKTISTLENGKSGISADLALAFEKIFGKPASFWLAAQDEYSLARERGQAAPALYSRRCDAPARQSS